MADKIFGYDFEVIKAMQQGTHKPERVSHVDGRDYGRDPLGDGKFKMIPSGRIVTLEESKVILGGG